MIIVKMMKIKEKNEDSIEKIRGNHKTRIMKWNQIMKKI